MALSDEILSDLKKKKGGGMPMKPKPDNAAEDAADGGADDAEEYGGDEASIAADLTDAIKSGDNQGVVDALKSFIEACYPQLAK